MDKESLLKMLKTEFPEKAIDLSENLELLKETIKDIIEEIGEKIQSDFSHRMFENLELFGEIAKEFSFFENQTDEAIALLDIDDLSDNTVPEEEQGIRTLPNYSEYVVDTNIEHTLYENFTHKRPSGFKLNEYKIVHVDTWQEMVVKTCELLMAIDRDKFLGFENSKTMNGKKRKYFSKDSTLMRNPKHIKDKIYIEVNQSANSLRNMLIKLLKAYHFNISDYAVYLRADYTNLKK
ncbi:MAG TPA: hypothetical protein P5107_08305 [Thermotogota bacterium]|nr:hypothetical protein [Thermotogota bacterium]HRW35044.1 hypothetical protein [Thermotogota bacterium]